jgi:hypothetical protein
MSSRGVEAMRLNAPRSSERAWERSFEAMLTGSIRRGRDAEPVFGSMKLFDDDDRLQGTLLVPSRD